MPIALTAKFDLLKRIVSLSSSAKVMDWVSSLQVFVTPLPMIVHVRVVLEPFFRIVTDADFPANGAGVMLKRIWLAVPARIASCTSVSIAAVEAAHGPKQVPAA